MVKSSRTVLGCTVPFVLMLNVHFFKLLCTFKRLCEKPPLEPLQIEFFGSVFLRIPTQVCFLHDVGKPSKCLSFDQRHKLILERAAFTPNIDPEFTSRFPPSYWHRVYWNISRHSNGGTPGHHIHGKVDDGCFFWRNIEVKNYNKSGLDVIMCEVLGGDGDGGGFLWKVYNDGTMMDHDR